MGIKQHNGNTKADRLAELKIRSPSIQLIKFGAIGLNAIIFSPLLIAADTGSQYGTNITINDGDRITGDTADPSGNLYGVMTPAGNTPGNINLGMMSPSMSTTPLDMQKESLFRAKTAP